LTISSLLTSPTAATIAARRSASSAAERRCMKRIALPRSRRPAGSSPTPAIWPSYANKATRSSCGRRSISRASATACSAVWTGERFGPILTRPPSAHQPASTSMQTRTGAAPPPSTDSIASRCSTQSTVTTGAPAGLATERSASSPSAPPSAVG